MRRSPPSPGGRRTASSPLAVAAALLVAICARADSEDLPAATRLDRITWIPSGASTRLELWGDRLQPPDVALTAAGVLRIDLSAADSSAIPRTLHVGTPEIRSIVKVPAETGALPDDVSVRLVVELARPDLGYRLDSSSERISILVSDAGSLEVVGIPLELGWYSEATAPKPWADQPPEPDERLKRTQSVALADEADVRAAPSPLASRIGTLPAGEKKVADARRGEWVHLVGGGWLRLPQLRAAAPPADAAPAATASRTPAAWAVVTLGTGLDLRVEEATPGDPEAALVERLYAEPVRLARFRVVTDPSTGYSFRLPSRKGRVVLEMASGVTVSSLDPSSLPLRDPSSRAKLDMAFAAPDVPPGATWRTWIVFPADVDFLKVEAARVDVDGRLQSLFRVPGSGEARR